MLVFALILVGLILGPFIGVVVDRAVDRERLALTHRCPVPVGGTGEIDPDILPDLCHGDLGRRSLLPVLNWFQKCPLDPTHRHWRYVLTDLATAAAFGALGYRFDLGALLIIYVILLGVLVAASVIDFETRLLLDILTKPTVLALSFVILIASPGLGLEESIWPAFAAGGFYFGLFGLMHLISPANLGLGDVKLAPTLGLAIGWSTTGTVLAIRLTMYSIIVASLLSFVCGATAGLILTRDWRKYPVPMGPFLVFGAGLMIVLSSPLST